MALDDDDKKFIAEAIAAAQTKAAETQGKAIEAAVGKAVKALDFEGKLTTLKGELDGKLEGLKPADPPNPPDPNKAAGSVKDDPEFKKLQAQVEESNRKAAEQHRRAEEAEAKRQAERLNNATRDALIAAGADPKRVPIALSHLLGKGTVKLDDKGVAVMTLRREWGEENVVIADAAKEWLATEDGKFFVPPSNAQGTGDRAGGQPSGKPTADPQRIALDALANLF